jgi:hypothetical protein
MLTAADLAACVAHPETVPLERVPDVLLEFGAQRAKLLTAEATLLARLAAGAREAAKPASWVLFAEAAEATGIPVADVRWLARQRAVPSLGAGKNKRVRIADLAAHLDRCGAAGASIRTLHGVTPPYGDDRQGRGGGPADARPHARRVRREARGQSHQRVAVGDGGGAGD